MGNCKGNKSHKLKNGYKEINDQKNLIINTVYKNMNDISSEYKIRNE